MAGPEYNRHLLLTHRHEYCWRTETNPVTRLLRRGVLVLDGEEHNCVRSSMEPSLLRRPALAHLDTMVRFTDQVVAQWRDGETYDMLVEMRKVALLILIGTLFGVNFTADLDRMWQPILRSIAYISPGLWILWHKLPRIGYRRDLRTLDDYLYTMIRQRRAHPDPQDDLLTRLVQNPAMVDDLVRDQLLTMLIAGHDTSTALFAWILYLLGEHPQALERVRGEIVEVVGTALPSSDHLSRLQYLDLVIRETLRMYPPIHIGNRKAAHDVQLGAYTIPSGNRVMYSIYLSHRDPAYRGGAGALRPRALRAYRQRQHPSLHLCALWWRPAQLHRRHFCSGRSQSRDGPAVPTGRAAARPQSTDPRAHGCDAGATPQSDDARAQTSSARCLAPRHGINMTYFGFLASFLGIPIAVLTVIARLDDKRARQLPAALLTGSPYAVIAALAAIAFLYTTPWDNYLVATRVWWYHPELVTGIIFAWVPIEEYTFFLLQPILTGLWFVFLARRLTVAMERVDNPAARRFRWIGLAASALVWLSGLAVLWTGYQPFTYMALLMVWALPPVLLQFAFGGDILWNFRRLLVLTVLPASIYLCWADATAIESGTWTINPAQSVNMLIGGLPLEEIIFFFMTNLLISFGMVLVLARESQTRAAKFLLKAFGTDRLISGSKQ